MKLSFASVRKVIPVAGYQQCLRLWVKDRSSIVRRIGEDMFAQAKPPVAGFGDNQFGAGESRLGCEQTALTNPRQRRARGNSPYSDE